MSQRRIHLKITHSQLKITPLPQIFVILHKTFNLFQLQQIVFEVTGENFAEISYAVLKILKFL